MTMDTETALMSILPTQNDQAGSYELTMQMLLQDYSDFNFSTTFNVVILPLETNNTPPVFAEELQVFMPVYKTIEPESWSYELPATDDADGDPVTI